MHAALAAMPSARRAVAATALQVRVLFDAQSELIIDAAGAVRGLLQYEPVELRAQRLGLLFGTEADEGELPWRGHGAGRDPGDRLATVLTKTGHRRVVNASVTAFRRTQGNGALGLLLLSDVSNPVGEKTAGAHAQRRLQTLAYELTVAEARERERVANGLHDSLGQLLAIAQFRLDELAGALPDDSLRQRAEELRGLLAQASSETRRATFDLHSPLLRQLGLPAAIEGLADRMRRQCHLDIQVEGSLDGPAPARAVQAVLLRVVRESLLNVYKHAQARKVTVRLCGTGGRLVISVADDGRGCERQGLGRTFSPEGGFGLASSEAQMQAIGGCLEVQSWPGQGTTVTLALAHGRTRPSSRASARDTLRTGAQGRARPSRVPAPESGT